MSDSLFCERLFYLFDENKKEVIGFPEFIKGLSVLCTRGTLDEKIQFTFRIYDRNSDGKITQDELSDVLTDCMKQNNVQITTEQIGFIIKETFRQVDKNKDGVIDYDEYKKLVSKHPSILDNMTLDFQCIVEQRLELMKKNAKTIHQLKSDFSITSN